MLHITVYELLRAATYRPYTMATSTDVRELACRAAVYTCDGLFSATSWARIDKRIKTTSCGRCRALYLATSLASRDFLDYLLALSGVHQVDRLLAS
jgi:hypothetical protein